jgi:hypothetical protein
VGGLGQGANRDEYGKESHFNPFLALGTRPTKCWRSLAGVQLSGNQ